MAIESKEELYEVTKQKEYEFVKDQKEGYENRPNPSC